MTLTFTRFAMLCAVLAAPGAFVHAQRGGDLPTTPGGPPPSNYDRQSKDAAPKAPPLARLTPKADPRQRLDTGALLCRTEADLQQHESAIVARLDGTEAPEPVGCRRVRRMTSVTVLDRHGPARTQVHIFGPPEETGWTDTVIRGE